MIGTEHGNAGRNHWNSGYYGEDRAYCAGNNQGNSASVLQLLVHG